MKEGGIFSRMIKEQEMERRISKDGEEESEDSFDAIEVENSHEEDNESVNVLYHLCLFLQ